MSVQYVMKLRLVRGMQGRQLVWAACIAASFLIFLGLHFQGEISRLDDARIKLEITLAKLQGEDPGRRNSRTPSEYIQGDAGYVTEVDDLVVIYNRVPKTGSTSFAGVAYDLCIKNKFNVLHINITKNFHVMSLADQMRFANNVTNWHAKKPAFYHGHFAYIEFSRFAISARPIYINVIRDPIERLISYYYFLRNGDNYRPYLKRRRSGNKETFDECVSKDGSDCDPENLWIQIPFFCGHAAECWIPGSRWALEMAKLNLVQQYLVVGVTEELGDFVAVLEAALPRMFTGATDLFNSGKKGHLRKTTNKIPPLPETISNLQRSDVWKLEQEFYDFAKEHFHAVKRRTFDIKKGYMMEKIQQFSYEKIRPR